MPNKPKLAINQSTGDGGLKQSTPNNKGKIDSFLNSVSEASDLILKCAKDEKNIHVASHIDADGLAAAGIIGKALARLDGKFRIRTERWIEDAVVDRIATENPFLVIFTDLGSGDIDLLRDRLPKSRILILDHHQPFGELSSKIIQVNPHLHGVDGGQDISGAGVTYFVAKAVDKANVDLACLAVVGALGDMQDKYDNRRVGGINEMIVEDATKAGYLKQETDLLFFGRETRPIHRALAYTTNPFMPGISGNEGGSYKFLKNLGIESKHKGKWRALRDLSDEEKQKLFSALAEYLASKGYPSDAALSLIGSVYILSREEPWTSLRDAREFSVVLNATGRMERPGVGIAICMGDREAAFEEANKILKEYRREVAKYLDWLSEKPDRIEKLKNIYVVKGGTFINEKVIGTVSSILSKTLPKLEKPIIAYSIISKEELAKISARVPDFLTKKGFTIEKILRRAAEKYSGRGGGHDAAAGAQVPLKNLESFIKLVDGLVEDQMEEMKIGGNNHTIL